MTELAKDHTRRICVRCVMDTSAPELVFDDAGVCNECRRAEGLLALLPQTEAEANARLEATAAKVRAKAAKHEYDCVVGLSGGVDSSYVALLAGQLGLRTLAVHFDNGWNSEIAVSNIHELCESFGLDLITYVINWDEFRDLQRSFLLASVVDVELVTDHAIFAAMLQLARQHDIPFILSGMNLATEAIMPTAWAWWKQDHRNIKAIHDRFGSVPLETFPLCGPFRWAALRYTPLGPTYVELLNSVVYRRGSAEETLARESGWRSYGGKHHESVFTRFYQCVLLPEKFGIDKRRAHLSSLIMNGETTRADALAELERPPIDPIERDEELAYVCKKLGFDEEEFTSIMRAAPVPHDAYPSNKWFFAAASAVRLRARTWTLRRARR